MNIGTVLSTLFGGTRDLAPQVEGAQGPPPEGTLPAFGQLLALLSAQGSDPAAAEVVAAGTGSAPPEGDDGGPLTEEELEELLARLIGQGQGEVRLDRPPEAGRSPGEEADVPPAPGRRDGRDVDGHALLAALAAGAVIPPDVRPETPLAGPTAHGAAVADPPADWLPEGRPALQAVAHAAAWSGVSPAEQDTQTTGAAVHVTPEDLPPGGEAPPITARDLGLKSAAGAAPPLTPAADRDGVAPEPPSPDLQAAAPALNGAGGAPSLPVEAAPEADAANAPPDRAAEARQVIDQVVEALELLARDEGHEVRLRLRPPELGELHIRMEVRGAAVSLNVTAEHQHVADLLRTHLPSLREALQQREIHVDQTLVWTGTSADSPWSGRGDGRGQTGERPPYAALPWERPASEPPRGLRPRGTDGDRLVDYRI